MTYYTSEGIEIPKLEIDSQPGVLCEPCSAAVNLNFKVNKKVFHPAGRPCICKENSSASQPSIRTDPNPAEQPLSAG